MPLFEFTCDECKNEFAIFHQSQKVMAEQKVACQICNSIKVSRKFSPAAIDMNGVTRMSEKDKREKAWSTDGKNIR